MILKFFCVLVRHAQNHHKRTLQPSRPNTQLAGAENLKGFGHLVMEVSAPASCVLGLECWNSHLWWFSLTTFCTRKNSEIMQLRTFFRRRHHMQACEYLSRFTQWHISYWFVTATGLTNTFTSFSLVRHIRSWTGPGQIHKIEMITVSQEYHAGGWSPLVTFF